MKGKTKTKYLLLSIVLLLVNACSPKLIMKDVNVSQSLPPWNEELGFVILSSADSLGKDESIMLGSLKVGERGFTAKCDQMTVMNMIKEQALAMGANGLVLKSVKGPDIWSTCFRVEAEAHYIEDFKKYERVIDWYGSRKLEIVDFKADPEDRPFIAATQTQLTYYFTRGETNKQINFHTSALFNCEKSYFNVREDSISVLNHEQRHFDFAEVYARKVIEELSKKSVTLNQFDVVLSEISSRLLEELGRIQDKYDKEVYEDPSQQKKWDDYIDNELDRLSQYKDKKLTINKR